jgi:hypothetical protein
VGPSGVPAEARGGEDELPRPLASGIRVLRVQRLWQGHASESQGPVGEVNLPRALQLVTQGREDGGGEHGDPVLPAFSLADGDLAAVEVQVLHAEGEGFQEPQPAAVEQGRHQPGHALQPVQQSADLLSREDHGEARGRADAGDGGKLTERTPQHVRVEEHERAEGLVLRRGAHAVRFGEVREKCRDFGGAECLGVPHLVMDDETAGPVTVGLFGSLAEVAKAARAAQPVEEPGAPGRRRDVGRMRGGCCVRGHGWGRARIVPGAAPSGRAQPPGEGSSSWEAEPGASPRFLRRGYLREPASLGGHYTVRRNTAGATGGSGAGSEQTLSGGCVVWRGSGYPTCGLVAC